MSDGLYDSLYSAEVDETPAQVSAVPVDIGAYHILNLEAAVTYILVYYKLAADVTFGTTVPDESIALPASGGATLNFAGDGWRTRGPLTLCASTDASGAGTPDAHVTLWRAR